MYPGMQPGMQPAVQPGMQPVMQPGMQGAMPRPGLPNPNDALGFDAAPKEEKYNTQYLTANLTKERRTTQLIILGVIVAAIAGVMFWVGMMPASPPVAAPGAAAADQAAAPESAAEAKDGAPAAGESEEAEAAAP
jgi:hypothetical protein